ncbi:MAG: 50S ribosomal protein L18e, partial [Candidatus Hydrothermarchaeales archaeon]
NIMKKSKSTNPLLLSEIEKLTKNSREKKAQIWRDLAKRLSKASSGRTEVNVGKISRHTQKGEVVAVPGKVLSAGSIDHPVTAAAFSFSNNAKEKITAVGGKCLSLSELASKNPKGKNIKIIG